MTDPPPPDIDDADELVSAVLDGEATAAEVARVEHDPDLAARLERFRSMAERNGTAPEPPPGLVDDAVASALTHLAPSAGHPTAPRFDEVSARRADKARRFAPLLAAAAAVVVVVVASVVALETLDSGESQDLATAGQAVEDETTSVDAGAATRDETADSAAESDDPSASPAAPGADAENFSAFPISASDLEGFENQVRDLLAENAVTTTTQGSPSETAEPDQVEAAARCATSDVDRVGSPILFGAGELDGLPVTYAVVVTERGRILVITDTSCEVIAELAL